MYSSEIIGNLAAEIFDISYLLILSAFFIQEFVAGKNWRNLLVVVPVVLLAATNIAIHGHMLGLWSDMSREALILGLFLVLVLLSMIGGRVVPSFTRNWLKQRGATHLPAPIARLDIAAIFR